MKKYKITLDLEKEITAEDEEEAIQIFFDEIGLENDCLENHIIAKRIKNNEKKV